MATSRKVDSIGAIRLQDGLASGGAVANNGWGDANAIQTLGTGNAFAYTTFNPKGEIQVVDDDSYEGYGFQDLPVQSLISAGGEIETNLRYRGIERLLYWAFGWERPGTSPVDKTNYYAHMFELDARDRHYAAYRSSPDEQTAGDYSAFDRKCRMATIGIKRGTNDYRYPHAMCNKISFKSSAGDIAKMNLGFVAYCEQRGDYSSANWTFPTSGIGSGYVIPHHHWTVEFGASGALAEIAVSEFSVDVDIPLNMIQDTESGLYYAEPVGEGKYTVSGSLTVSRHTADTILAHRDAFDTLACSMIANTGYDSFKILLPSIKIKTANVDDQDVPKIPIEFTCGKHAAATHPFADDLEDNVIIQESPIVVIANTNSSTNEMRRE